MEPTKAKVITHVYNFHNGQTLVFDQYGEQMPEYQGCTEEVMPKIRAAGYTAIVETIQWSRPR